MATDIRVTSHTVPWSWAGEDTGQLLAERFGSAGVAARRKLPAEPRALWRSAGAVGAGLGTPVALSVIHPLFGEVAAGIEIGVDGSHENCPVTARWLPAGGYECRRHAHLE